MFWIAGLILVLAISQVPAEYVKAAFVEDVRNASASSNRIVSGWEAYPGQIPHQVSLRMVNSAGGVSGCGGSVVAREWVITAAHCTAGQITIVTRAGLVSLTTPQYMFETQEWYNYPTYNDNNPGLVQPNDISVMKLQKPVTYSRLLQPIRLQSSSEAHHNYDNELVIASGFGRTWTNSATSEVLNWVYLRAVSNRECEQLFGSALITPSAICARFYNVTSQSTCQGDSGGPLVHVGSDAVPVLVGIASFVAGGDFGCHSGLPAGFIRPGPFLPWLQQVTGIDFENLNEEPQTTAQPEVPTTQTNAPSPPGSETWLPTWPTTEPPQATEIEPQTTRPTTTPPQSTWPNTTPPQSTWPDTTPPQSTWPNTTPPQSTWPNTTPPQSTWPNTTPPQSTWPNTTPPQSTWPQTTESTARPTTAQPPAPTTTPEPEEESEEDSSSEEEEPEISELLKKLIIKVKVKVNVNNTLKKKVKVKCVDKA